jgi:predicted NBD/HSP70 family sugar kinase
VERRTGKPSLLRSINLRTTFEIIRDTGPVAAAQIAAATGLSKPTVSDVIGQLVDGGMVARAGRTTGRVGPSARLYEVDPRAGWVVAVDVGRERVRVAVADLRGEVVGRVTEPTARRSAQHIVRQLLGAVENAVGEAGVDPRRVHQAVVGTPGVIRPGEDHLSLAPQLPAWDKPGVVKAIRDGLAVPTTFENDVNLAALGEGAHGVSRGVREFVYLSIGTGVGMATVLDGTLHRGFTGLAGEVGYLPLGDGVDQRTDNPARWHEGTFEQWVSSAAVVQQAGRAGMRRVRSAEEVFAAARIGSRPALRVVTRIAERIAVGVAAVAAVLDPELVVLGGGIGAGGGALLLEPLAHKLALISPLSPRLAISTLGPDAVLAGAIDEALRLAVDRVFGGDLVTRPKDQDDREEQPA